jgi:hypothetical protein
MNQSIREYVSASVTEDCKQTSKWTTWSLKNWLYLLFWSILFIIKIVILSRHQFYICTHRSPANSESGTKGSSSRLSHSINGLQVLRSSKKESSSFQSIAHKDLSCRLEGSSSICGSIHWTLRTATPNRETFLRLPNSFELHKERDDPLSLIEEC